MKYFFALFVFMTPICLQAGVYKWVDDQGNIHYGDKPQIGEAVQIQIDKAPESTSIDQTSREERRQRVSDSFEEDRLEKKAEREKIKKEHERKLKECNWLKDKQKHFKRANALYKLDKDGNRVFISDEARKQTEQELRKQIKQACG